MEAFAQHLANLDPLLVYLTVAAIAYIENIFPPFPSDVIVVAAGSLTSIGHVDFTILLATSAIGSTVGFLTMYQIGRWFGSRILASGRLRFLPQDQIQKVEAWFRQYGLGIIVANRFLAGTRAVVSFFAGMSLLPLTRTTILSFLSALAWNFLLLYAGMMLGQNWQKISFYLEIYGETVTSLLIFGILVYVGIRIYRRYKANGQESR